MNTPEILTLPKDSGKLSLDPLRDQRIAVLGFGNQGSAHALNLRDSGFEVLVANRPDSPNGQRALSAGFVPHSIPKAIDEANLVILALPDEVLPELYATTIEPLLAPGTILGFLHGFNIRYQLVNPREDLGVVMVAPKGPGATLRKIYVEDRGIPCLYALHQSDLAERAESIALAWATGIGCARAGVIRTTFADETECDLFGEQAVLCGGLSELIYAAYETLVERGYPPALAYLECCHEVKQVADLIYSRGMAGMFQAISSTAEYGAHVTGSRVIDDHVRERLTRLLDEIRDGAFAREFRHDAAEGFRAFAAWRQRRREHPMEDAGQAVRALMPWLKG